MLVHVGIDLSSSSDECLLLSHFLSAASWFYVQFHPAFLLLLLTPFLSAGHHWMSY